MPHSPHTEHECSAYCRGNRHADVFWTPADDTTIANTAPAFLARHGLRFVHWEQAPEARLPEGETLIRYNAAGEQDFAAPDPSERPILLVWEVPAAAD